MKKLILALILLLAAVLRFYQLGSNPPSLYWDEVALGYNAYSIAETLKDEEGRYLPLDYFRSFGDFKPPVYIYAAVPMMKLLGPSEWTTRFPSAAAGVLSVLLTYLITKILFNRINKRDEKENYLIRIDPELVALLAAFLLAVSPWHTQISRVAYEANVALVLVLLGVYVFLKGLESTKFKLLYFLTFTITFVLTLYTFNSNRVFSPLFGVFIILVFWKDIAGRTKYNFKPFIIAGIIGLLLLAPLIPHLTSKEGQLRYKEVNIFTDSTPVELSNERAERLGNTWWAKLINNRRVLFMQKWFDGYFNHFNGKFLFITGDTNPRFSLQEVGELYLVELPFLLIGLYLFASRLKKEHIFIVGWMLLGPVPAAFARETPHALRALNMLPTFQIIIAFGIVYSLIYLNEKYKQHKLLKSIHFAKKTFNILTFTVAGATIFLGTLNILYYLHNYYMHFSKHSEQEWQYGYKQMVTELAKIQDKYDRIVITDALGRPYIETLFYLKYPPAKFQEERRFHLDKDGFGFVEVDGFGKYEFRGLNWKNDIALQDERLKTLEVGNAQELKENKFTQAVIHRQDGSVVFILNELPTGYDAQMELNPNQPVQIQ
jgi:4-amino-4-deoxy-L-arabinose transferase-like glycosyltransferase